jgi:tetratricopeptide (TPR) repeat protein
MRSRGFLGVRSLFHLLATTACLLWLDIESVEGTPSSRHTSADTCAPNTSSLNSRAATLTVRGYDRRIQAGIDLIYSLRFEEADLYFDAVVDAEPDNPLGYFFRAMTSWWRVLVDLEDRRHDELFYRQLQTCIDVCDRRLKETPDDFDAILFKGGSIGFRGRLRGDRGQFLKAARDGLRSMPLVERSRKLEPTNKDILFGQGLYDYFAVIMPERHPIIRPIMWFLRDGDKERGLKELEEVAYSGLYARVEAKYFLSQIYHLFEGDPARALRYQEELRQQYPDNAVFHRNTARTLVALSRWPQALQLYREYLHLSEQGRAGYHVRGCMESLFYIGKRAFNLRRSQDAIRAFAAIDSLSYTLGEEVEVQAMRGYTALANLYLGMAYDETGRRELALASYQRVRQLPRQRRSRELAKRYLQRAYTRDPNDAVAGPTIADPSHLPAPTSKDLE